MSLVLILVAATFGTGCLILVHSVLTAPEGNEGTHGFSLSVRVKKTRKVLKPEVMLEPTASHAHRITAA